MPSNRFFSIRFFALEGAMMLAALASFVPSIYAQGNPSNGSQTVVADPNNNGLNSPGVVAVGANGNLFIVDTANNRVVEEPWNSSTKTYGAQAVLIENLSSPDGAAVGANGNVFIADTGNNRVIEIPWSRATGAYGQETTVGAGLQSPHGVAVAANGNVFIADTGNNRVVEVPWERTTGAYGPQTLVGTDLLSPQAVALSQEDKVYIANAGNNSVVEIPAGCNAANSCTIQTTVASQETNGLANPAGVAVAPGGNVYIADTGNNRVVELPWNRTTGAYGPQKMIGVDLVEPKGIALDAVGSVYIADTGNNRILKIAQSGGRPNGNHGLPHARP